MKERIELQIVDGRPCCLRIRLNTDGRCTFCYVRGEEIIQFPIEFATLVRLSLGETTFIDRYDASLLLYRYHRTIQLIVQVRGDDLVEFEMPLEKFAVMVSTMMHARQEMESIGHRRSERLVRTYDPTRRRLDASEAHRKGAR